METKIKRQHQIGQMVVTIYNDGSIIREASDLPAPSETRLSKNASTMELMEFSRDRIERAHKILNR